MNFIFISPHFPESNHLFCQSLRNNNVNVLGIGDQDYETFSDELKQSLTDYHKVSNLENYQEVLRACGYFTYQYGRIDRIESLNEYWLENDAKLRTDFNVEGIKNDEILEIKRKSCMKKFYDRAGVPFAKYLLVNDFHDLEKAKDFVHKVGYPIIAKPDIGVGAFETFDLQDDDELSDFLSSKPHELFLLEEFVPGNIITFDGITDSQANILYCTTHFLPVSLMDIVTKDLDVSYHSQITTPDIYETGQRTLKAFNAKSKFFHFEYFLLNKEHPSYGKKGSVIALEVNMRPGGAYIPDMINYAADIDIYQLWADMVCCDKIGDVPKDPKYFCGYVGRKFNKLYRHSHDDIMETYGDNIVLTKEVEEIFSRAMGKYVYIFRSDDIEQIKEIIEYITH